MKAPGGRAALLLGVFAALTLTAAADPTPTRQLVHFRTEPSGALVHDGRDPLGVSSSPLPLDPTTYGDTVTFSFSLAGYQNTEVTVFKSNLGFGEVPPPGRPPVHLEPLYWWVPWLAFVRKHALPLGVTAALAAIFLVSGRLGLHRAGLRRKLERQARAMGEESEGSLVQEVLGDYRLVAVLGEGGMGVVYRALLNATLNPKDAYACKVIRRKLSEEPEFRQRFEREIKVCLNLRHPNIVQMAAYGEHKGRLYLVMELVKGKTLADLIPSGGLPLGQARDLVAQICAGVAAAHEHGIVHRDLKPENIMVNDAGQVKLMDFGLARRLEAATKITQTGGAVGTPAYMPPEQITGGEVDERADQYALGVIVFELLTGRTPFQAADVVEMLFKHLQQDPPPLDNVPPEVSAAVARMLSKGASERFPSVKEAWRAMAAGWPS